MPTEPGQAALRRAIRDALAERGMTQRELGAEVGHIEKADPFPQQSVAEWLSGRVTIGPARVFAIERALKMQPGQLSRLEGYVPVDATPMLTPEEAIDLDPDINPMFRRLLAGTIAQARQESRASRSKRGSR